MHRKYLFLNNFYLITTLIARLATVEEPAAAGTIGAIMFMREQVRRYCSRCRACDFNRSYCVRHGAAPTARSMA
jgi:hypothetical protein